MHLLFSEDNNILLNGGLYSGILCTSKCKIGSGGLVIVLLDGILIYSNNEEEHVEHLRLTLKLLRKHKLYAGLSKCDFYENINHHLGHIISNRGISGDPENIEAMLNWSAPRNLIDVISLVGLAGYCRKITEEDFAGKFESTYGLRNLACELVVP